MYAEPLIVLVVVNGSGEQMNGCEVVVVSVTWVVDSIVVGWRVVVDVQVVFAEVFSPIYVVSQGSE